MPKPKRGPRLGSGPAHQKQILAGQASDLFRYGRIRTTQAKAKQLRPYAERLITKAKRGDIPARRQVMAKLGDRDVVAYLFEDVAPRFAERDGGYTRILKLGPRAGDAAPMALIELVEQGETFGDEEIEEAKRQRARGLFGRLRGRRGEAVEDVYDDDEFLLEPDDELDDEPDEDEVDVDEVDEELDVDEDVDEPDDDESDDDEPDDEDEVVAGDADVEEQADDVEDDDEGRGA